MTSDLESKIDLPEPSEIPPAVLDQEESNLTSTNLGNGP